MASIKRTTIYDIARELNITPASVSRALNDDHSIGKTTKERVKNTALRLNYKPNSNALHLSTGKSRTLGVVVPRINNNFFANVIAGIESVAREKNYHVLICQSFESFEVEVSCINTLIHQNVACIMISLSTSTTSTAHLEEITKYHIPLIQFDRTDEKLKSQIVINDNEEVVYEAIEHLASQGYKRIAHLAGPQNVTIFRKRKEGFEKGLHSVQLPLYEGFIQYDCLTKEAGMEATFKLLNMKNPPDAIFAAADLGALGALEAAKKMKISVPHTLGICGFSNEPYTELTTPSITTIDQDSFGMGETVADLFFENKQTAKKKLSKPVVIGPKLIVRESTNRKE